MLPEPQGSRLKRKSPKESPTPRAALAPQGEPFLRQPRPNEIKGKTLAYRFVHHQLATIFYDARGVVFTTNYELKDRTGMT